MRAGAEVGIRARSCDGPRGRPVRAAGAGLTSTWCPSGAPFAPRTKTSAHF